MSKRRIHSRNINNDKHFDDSTDQTKANLSVVVSPIIASTDLTKTSFHRDSKFLKFIVPQTSPSIKMLTNGDGLSSALRIPTKIQLTKSYSTSANIDYPLTPPPPILSEQQNHLKRHSISLSNWSLPSPTSFSSNDSSIEIDLEIKQQYHSLSFSCPILPSCREKTKSTKTFNRKNRSLSPVIKYSSIERLKRRRRDHRWFEKRFKLKSSIEQDEENELIIQNLLNEMIESLSKDMIVTQQSPISHCLSQINDQSYSRQSSTPLSFHSVVSSTTDEQIISSPLTNSKTQIYTDIVNELIQGAKGLDKLSYSLANFAKTIHDFLRLTIDKQTEKVDNLQSELEKKCSSQFNRANLFCTKKIQYFLSKHSIQTINDHLDEITLIVKYFYFYVLFINYRKQENEYEEILTDLISGKLTFINELFSSSILTKLIEEFILSSTLANDYLLSQPILINQIEYSLPFVRNHQYENELLYQNDALNPFVDFNDLENYLNSCEHLSSNIPYYPFEQSSVTYPSTNQYYSPYYYSYSYNHSSNYYNSHLSNYNEQYNYYYNQPISYNNTNDIPIGNQNFYRRTNTNHQTSYPETVYNSSNTLYPS